MTTTAKTEGPVGNSEPRGRGHGRRVLAACGLAHFAHDGFSDTIYLLLPVWAENFGLSHAEVGILKTVFSGSLASSQLPAGLLAERWGARWVLVISTLVVGASFMALGLAGGFIGLAVLLCCAGVASGAQHTLSSTLVAEAYRDGRLRAALGTYNFTGDLGKVAAPVLMAGGIALMGWRASSLALGAFGCVVGIGLFIALKRLGTGELNRFVQAALDARAPKIQHGKPGKIFYATQTGVGPPTIAIYVNDPRLFDQNYRRYLENRFRDTFDFPEVPVRIDIRSRTRKSLSKLKGGQRKKTP